MNLGETNVEIFMSNLNKKYTYTSGEEHNRNILVGTTFC